MANCTADEPTEVEATNGAYAGPMAHPAATGYSVDDLDWLRDELGIAHLELDPWGSLIATPAIRRARSWLLPELHEQAIRQVGPAPGSVRSNGFAWKVPGGSGYTNVPDLTVLAPGWRTGRRQSRDPLRRCSSSRWPRPPPERSTGAGSSPTTASVVRRCICSSTCRRPSRSHDFAADTVVSATDSISLVVGGQTGSLRPHRRHSARRSGDIASGPWPRSTPSTRRRGTSSSSSAPARDCSPWSRARSGRTGDSAARGSGARRSTPPRSTAAAVAPGCSSAPPARTGGRRSTGPTTSAPRGWSPSPTTLAFPDDTGAAVAQGVAAAAGRRRRARRRLRRRRARRPLPVRRRRRVVPAEPGPLGPRAPAAVAAGRRRPLPAHRHPRPGRRPAPRRRRLGRRLLPDARRRTWEAANVGIRAPFLPDPTPEFGQCVHKVDRHPAEPDTLFLQHHWGVYRSDDFGGTLGGDRRRRPAVDLRLPDRRRPEPTRDGLRAAADVRRVPLHARRPAPRLPHHRRRRLVGRPRPTGCPRSDAWLTVLRDGFAADTLDPAGLYVGTRTGDVFASADGGRVVDGAGPPPAARAVRQARGPALTCLLR